MGNVCFSRFWSKSFGNIFVYFAFFTNKCYNLFDILRIFRDLPAKLEYISFCLLYTSEPSISLTVSPMSVMFFRVDKEERPKEEKTVKKASGRVPKTKQAKVDE